MERRDREADSVPEREIREARNARLVTVDHVEASLRQRELEVRTNPDRHTDPARPRDRHGRPESDEPLQERPALLEVAQSAPAVRQLRSAVRRREDAHRVAARFQRLRGRRDVIVHVMGLGPREGGDQADAQPHHSDSM